MMTDKFDDPIVAEIRGYREEIAARHNYDIRKIFASARRRQKSSQRKSVARVSSKTTGTR